jgi:hypothetical protein
MLSLELVTYNRMVCGRNQQELMWSLHKDLMQEVMAE